MREQVSKAWDALARIRYYLSLYRTNDASSTEVFRMIQEVLDSDELDDSPIPQEHANA